MRIRTFALTLAIALATSCGIARAEDGTVDTPQDMQSTSEAATRARTMMAATCNRPLTVDPND